MDVRNHRSSSPHDMKHLVSHDVLSSDLKHSVPSTGMDSITLESVEYLVRHVVLPPKLPTIAEDSRVIRLAEHDLLTILISQLKVYFRRLTSDPRRYLGWSSVQKMLRSLLTLNSSPTLSSNLLLKAFVGMEKNGESIFRSLSI